MHFKKLDLNLLVALDALLSEVSIGRAAERLHMSQSAMSSALGRLRSYFDDPLLVQMGRRMDLSPRAAALRDPVREVLMQIEATVATKPQFVPQESDREFRLLVSDYTLFTLAPHVVALGHSYSRSLRFRWLPLVDRAHRALERGDADMVIRPGRFCSADHPAERLWTEQFVCVVCSHSEHVRHPMTLQRYVAAEHVVMQPNDTTVSFEAEILQELGTARQVAVTSYGFMSNLALVVNTERIATAHRRLALIAQRSFAVSIVHRLLRRRTWSSRCNGTAHAHRTRG